MAQHKDGGDLTPRVAEALQRLHAHELSGVVRYLHYAHMIFGANRIPRTGGPESSWPRTPANHG